VTPENNRGEFAGKSKQIEVNMSINENDLNLTPAEAVRRCQVIFAHAWMVRTFVKHSEVIEDFPELMQIVRTVFDTSRALEPKVAEPAAYLGMLRKKIGKLKAAAVQFGVDAPQASDHTNFRQAVISMDGCAAALQAILDSFPPPPIPSMPANFRTASNSVSLSTAEVPPPAE
jgi:hypothetical protein